MDYIGPLASSPHDAHTLALGTTDGAVLGTLTFNGYNPGAGQNVTFKQNHILQLAGQVATHYGNDPIGAITWITVETTLRLSAIHRLQIRPSLSGMFSHSCNIIHARYPRRRRALPH